MNEPESLNTPNPKHRLIPPGMPLFNQLFETMSEGFALHKVIYDKKGKPSDYIILDVNPAFEKFFDFKKDQVTGKRLSDIWGSGPSRIEIYAERVTSGKSYSYETYYSPTKKYFHITYFSPQTDLIVAIFTDITGYKITEEKLKQSEAKFRILAEESPNMIFINTGDSIAYVNKKCEELLGYTREEYYSPDFNFLSIIAPESRDLVLNNFNRRKQGEDVGDCEYTLISKEGKRIESIVSMGLIQYENSPAFMGIVTDISERKKIDRKNKQLAAIVENSHDAIVETTLGGYFKSWNKGAEKIFGYKDKEIIGKSISILIPYDHLHQMFSMYEKLLREETIDSLELEVLRSDGTRIVVSLTVSPVYDIENRLFSVSIVARDITFRKKAEIALQESERRFRELVELLPEMVFEIDLEGNLLFTNEAYSAIFGYRDLKNEKINIFDHIIPEDRDRTAVNIRNVCNGDKLGAIEYRVINNKGSPVPVLISSRLMRNDRGTVTGLRGIMIDISERKKTEEQILLNEVRLESLLRISQCQEENEQKLLELALEEAVKLTRSKIGCICYYDETSREFTLKTCSSEVFKECSVANPQTGWKIDQTGLWGEVIRRRKPVIINDFSESDTWKKSLPAGHPVLRKYMSIPVFVEEKIVAAVGVANKAVDYDRSDERQLALLMDSVWKIIEKQRVREELNSALIKLQKSYELEKAQRQELQEEAKARGMFLNVLGHELRTPLTPLFASSSILQESWEVAGDEIKKKLVNNIQTSILSLGERLEELLDLAKLSRGTFSLKKQPIDLEIMIRKVATGYQLLAEKQKKYLNIDSAMVKIGSIEADPGRIEQVLSNLISNALKYSPENTSVILKAFKNDKEAVIEVQDQGIGISPEEQRSLFQPYHRVEQDRTRYPGIGLGLAVSKQIVEAHGGRITLKSRLGEGSTFTIHLPVQENI